MRMATVGSPAPDALGYRRLDRSDILQTYLRLLSRHALPSEGCVCALTQTLTFLFAGFSILGGSVQGYAHGTPWRCLQNLRDIPKRVRGFSPAHSADLGFLAIAGCCIWYSTVLKRQDSRMRVRGDPCASHEATNSLLAMACYPEIVHTVQYIPNSCMACCYRVSLAHIPLHYPSSFASALMIRTATAA